MCYALCGRRATASGLTFDRAVTAPALPSMEMQCATCAEPIGIGGAAMSNAALNLAWPLSLPVSCKVTLARLADLADAADTCFPSVQLLVKHTGLSRRGVQKALAELERRHLIRRDERHRSGSTLYRLTLVHPEDAQAVRDSAVSAPVRSECADAQPVPITRAVSAPRSLTEPKEERTLLRSDATAIAVPSESERPRRRDAAREVWTVGLTVLKKITGKPEGPARKLLGNLLKAAGDDAVGVLAAIDGCPEHSKDPIAWLMAAAMARGAAKRSATDAIRDDWDLPTLADPSLLSDGPRIGMLT